MANLVFYDFETSSSNVSYGQIIQAAAVLVNDNFQELDRYEGRCKLSPGVVPESMALLVNKTTPKIYGFLMFVPASVVHLLGGCVFHLRFLV